jgi:glycolate oxidase
VTVGGIDLASRRTDRSGFIPEGLPAAVVFPRTAEEVSEVLRDASVAGTPVVPRGAGTGLAGGATAGAGSIVLDLSRMTGLSISPADRIAHAEPGVITAGGLRCASTA